MVSIYGETLSLRRYRRADRPVSCLEGFLDELAWAFEAGAAVMGACQATPPTDRSASTAAPVLEALQVPPTTIMVSTMDCR